MWYRGKCTVGDALGHIVNAALTRLLEDADGDMQVYIEVETDGSFRVEKPEGDQ